MMLTIFYFVVLFLTVATNQAALAQGKDGTSAPTAYFQPPPYDAYPAGKFGESVKRGENIFLQTSVFAKDYVGNTLSCVNCHLDKGRLPHSAPMWAAWVAYPTYRDKDKRVDTMEDRLIGCFTYSMNAQASKAGVPPKAGDQILTDLQSYMFWLAKGAPTGEQMAGKNYPQLEKPKHGYDTKRGEKVYQERCVVCHGTDGQGLRIGDKQQFPALWGNNSYNWGAGMHRINTAAGFIQANMPLGNANLSEQEAWDVAAYMNNKARPFDPRVKLAGKAAGAQFHEHDCFHGNWD